MRRMGWVVGALGLVLAGCANETGQLLVRVDSNLLTDQEPAVPGDVVLRAVNVLVCEGSCDEPLAPRVRRHWSVTRASRDGAVSLPFSFGIAPREPDLLGTLDIRVSAMRSVDPDAPEADMLFSTRRLVSFIRGRSVPVPIFLAAGCLVATCPEGTTCDDSGQCVGAPDAGMLDAGTDEADTGLDVGFRLDADLDAGVDASFDVGVDVGSDAGNDVGPGVDAWSCMHDPLGAFSTPITITAQRGVDPGSVSAIALATDGGELVAGRGASPTGFTWEGVTATAPSYFVSRSTEAGVPMWTTLIGYDPTRRHSIGGIARVAHQGDIVYVVGTAAEEWVVVGAGVTRTILEPVSGGTATDSAQVGVMVLALDATTGAPLWARTLKTRGVTEFVGGIAVDESGIWVATRGFGGTVGEFNVDRLVRNLDRGVLDGRAHLAHLAPDGLVLSVHGFGGPTTYFRDVDVAAVEGDVIVSFNGDSLALDGISPMPAMGPMIVARLRPTGASLWSTTLTCGAGTWRVQSGRLAVHQGRTYVGATALPESTQCSTIRVRARDIVRTPGRPSAWLGVLPLDTCTGESLDGALWSSSINGFGAALPNVAINGLDADARGVVVTGYVGRGGGNLGLGLLGGREVAAGSGTDGFLVVLGPTMSPRYTTFLGGTAAASNVDDGGENIALARDGIHLAVAMTGEQIFGGFTIPAGGRILHFALP